MAGHLETYGWDNSYFPRLSFIPSAAPVSDGDYLIRKTGSVYTWQAPASSAHRVLEWQWNGTDASQFEASPFTGSTGTNMSGITLGAVADADMPRGRKLRLTATGAGTGYAVTNWLVKSSESTLSFPGLYEWEIIVKPTFAAYAGLCFLADPATDHYYAWAGLNVNGTRSRVDAGTVIDILGGGTNANLLSTANLHRVRIRLWCDHEAGAKPRFVIDGEGHSFGSDVERVLEEPNGTWQTSGTTPPVSWHDKSTNRWGLNLTSISSGFTGNLDIVDMKLFKLGTAL